MAVGAGPEPESVLLANIYAAALRYYGTPAHVDQMPDPLIGLDSGKVSVVPGLTGPLLQRFQPGAGGRSDEQVYRALIGALPEGVSAGDYTTAAEDKPALAVAETTATAWGGSDLTTLVQHCAQVQPGALRGARTPAAVGKCKLPPPREFTDKAVLFNALRSGQINAAWTTTADPGVPSEFVVLADKKPMLIQAANVVPLYRRNELTACADVGDQPGRRRARHRGAQADASTGRRRYRSAHRRRGLARGKSVGALTLSRLSARWASPWPSRWRTTADSRSRSVGR